MSAEDVAQYMRTTIRKGPDGVARNLEDTLFQMSAWLGETLNSVKPLADDEANLIAAIRTQTAGDATALATALAPILAPLIPTGISKDDAKAAALEAIELAFARGAGQ